jgi:hypothetical protein
MASSARGRADWQKLATTKVESLSKIAPRVTYEMSAADVEGGGMLQQDGAVVRPNEAIAIDPGSHTVEASASGKTSVKRTFEIRNGDKLRVPISFVSSSSQATVSYGGEPNDGGNMRTLGLVVGGAGVIAIGVGAVTGILAFSKHDDAVANCPSYPDRCSADGSGTRANEDSKTFATVSTITFVAGGVLLAAGGVLFFTAGPKHAASIRIAPAVAARDAGFVVHGSF